jgi:general secretion pathway protein I
MREGFTLVEILVALAIAGVALAAAYRSVAQSTETATAVRVRTLAMWVAQNRLAELQIAPGSLPAGERSGRALQGGAEFWWREQVGSTPNPRFRRVDITVGEPARPTYTLAQLVGYVSPQSSP